MTSLRKSVYTGPPNQTAAPYWEASIVRRLHEPAHAVEALLDLYDYTCGEAWAWARQHLSPVQARARLTAAYLAALEHPEAMADLRVPLGVRILFLLQRQLGPTEASPQPGGTLRP